MVGRQYLMSPLFFFVFASPFFPFFCLRAPGGHGGNLPCSLLPLYCSSSRPEALFTTSRPAANQFSNIPFSQIGSEPPTAKWGLRNGVRSAFDFCLYLPRSSAGPDTGLYRSATWFSCGRQRCSLCCNCQSRNLPPPETGCPGKIAEPGKSPHRGYILLPRFEVNIYFPSRSASSA